MAYVTEKNMHTFLTSVTNNKEANLAVMLAKSLRQTFTTRAISVIVCWNLSQENRNKLAKSFDSIIYFSGESENQALIHAFSLTFFKKCIYLSPTCVVLENADKLFDKDANFKLTKSTIDGPRELSLLVLTPCQETWMELLKDADNNGKKFFSHRITDGQNCFLSDDLIAKFSVKKGALITDQAHASIVKFVEFDEMSSLSEEMQGLWRKEDLGIFEKHVIATWLQILHETFPESLKDRDLTSANEPSSTRCNKPEPIAIVGMSCRFPRANNLEEFWSILQNGEEGIREPPEFRWTRDHSLNLPLHVQKTRAGFLSDPVDEFDNNFFGLSLNEVSYIDPQTRLLLEVMWESLEDACIDPFSLYGTHTGVFTANWMHDYKEIINATAEANFFRVYMGNGIGAAAARISFLLGCTGPSTATESGCSGSIAALDLAVKSLRNEETSLAIVGGVNLLLHPFTAEMMAPIVSPDGRCKTFDSKADGFGRAEGCGVLVLKRLHEALHDGDNIWGVIRGSAVVQEGLSKSLGTPTINGEALAMRLAMKNAHVSPEDVSYIETHGTGTVVGDPIEVSAITMAFDTPNRKSPLVIGSVKTNVGHTEACSGLTGLIKTVLCFHNELIPKHLNLKKLNPDLHFDPASIMIPHENLHWPRIAGRPRLAGVSSFGITGTNGHIIIEEAPDKRPCKLHYQMQRPLHLFKISAKTSEALDELINQYEHFFNEKAKALKGTCSETFADAAYSANIGRANFPHRLFFIADNYANAAKLMKANNYFHGEGHSAGWNRKIGFLFTGQGSQYLGMAKMLYETSPVFRLNFDMCERSLKEYRISIQDVLYHADSKQETLSQTLYSQISIFCVEYCLLKLWQSWGIEPDYVLGHSLGEFCAAVAAGILNFKEALDLVVERSRLIDKLPNGRMLVINSSQLLVDKLLKSGNFQLDLAALNSPQQTVVAGNTEQVESFLKLLKENGIKAMILDTNHAFHSRHMDPMLKQYKQIAEKVIPKLPCDKPLFISSVEGRAISEVSDVGPDYWVRHTRQHVSFIAACDAITKIGCDDFVEIGGQPILSTFMIESNAKSPPECFPSLRRGHSDWKVILESLGRLYLLGYQINWRGLDEAYLRHKVRLPFHPLKKTSHWIHGRSRVAPEIHPLIGHSVENASKLSIFQADIYLGAIPYVRDHVIGNLIIFPGACFIEMLFSAGHYVAEDLEALKPPTRPVALANVEISKPMELKEETSYRLQVTVELTASTSETLHNDGYRINIYRQNDLSSDESAKWVLHASGSFIPVPSTTLSMWNPDLITHIINNGHIYAPQTFYDQLDKADLRFGGTFKTLKMIRIGEDEDYDGGRKNQAVTEIIVPSDSEKYIFHPLIIDATFQTAIVAKRYKSEMKLILPVQVNHISTFGPIKFTPGQSLFVHGWSANENYNAIICSQDLTPLAYFEGITTVESNILTIQSILENQRSQIPDSWEVTWSPLQSPFTNSMKINKLNANLDADFKLKLDTLGRTPDELRTLKDLTDKLIYLFIIKAFNQLGWKPVVGTNITVESFQDDLKILPEHTRMIRFYFKMLEKVGCIVVDDDANADAWKVLSPPPNLDSIQSQIDFLRPNFLCTNMEVMAAHYEHFSQHLVPILQGKTDPLRILFPDGDHTFSANRMYHDHPGRQTVLHLTGELVKGIYHQAVSQEEEDNKTAIYRVLEVGAGLGTLSFHLLRQLSEQSDNKFEYYYTDISQSFFLKAKVKFEEYAQYIKYIAFNIEESPLDQGIPVGYFDMVTGTDVLHATRDLEETMLHIRQTLKPTGIMVFTETIKQDLEPTFCFGPLKGYWRFEDHKRRQLHCCVETKVWEEVLTQTGFQNVEFFKTYCDQLGVIMAVANPQWNVELVATLENCRVRKKWIAFADAASFELVAQLANTLEAYGDEVLILSKTNKCTTLLKRLRKCVYVEHALADNSLESQISSLLNETVDGKCRVSGVIYAWGMHQFETDQRNIVLPLLHITKAFIRQKNCSKLIVLTNNVFVVNENSSDVYPMAATLHGMVKSMKNEKFNISIRCIDLENEAPVSTKVEQVIFEIAMSEENLSDDRLQLAYRGKQRHEMKILQTHFEPKAAEMKLPPSTEAFQVALPKTRDIQNLSFEPLLRKKLDENEIEVKVKAYALNFRDVLIVLKPTAEFVHDNSLATDFAGVVTSTGALSKWKVGDFVMGPNFDHPSPNFLRIESGLVCKIPNHMTFWEAATLPVATLTINRCLFHVTTLKRGETILIHTASGGVGLLAIQIAKKAGAMIVTTAGSNRKRNYLRSIGIEHVFNSRDTSFEKHVLEVTNGKGVDVVINTLTSEGMKEATLNVCGKNARFLELSKISIWTPREVAARRPDVFYKIVGIHNTPLTDMMVDMSRLMHDGVVKPLPYTKFDALYYRQALQYLQKAKHIGKVVVVMPEIDTLAGAFRVRIPLFNSDSTYWITGGLGGIGIVVCKWMLEHGATNIVLTGRNPPPPSVESLIQDWNNKGFNIVIRLGNIACQKTCIEIVDSINRSKKPLRGIMHSAGVLQDFGYSNQTWESFDTTFQPKVTGTFNLHSSTLACALEHFVVFSSMAALMGTPGQANHAAANCFLDAFVHYRHSIGLPATSINWGQWAEVGVATDVKVGGVSPISVARMLNGLEIALRTQQIQIGFCEFSSIQKCLLTFPILRFYVDERQLSVTRDPESESGVSNSNQFWKEMDAATTKEEKIAVVLPYLKAIFRKILQYSSDTPLDEASSTDTLGFDSLMLITLKNFINKLVEARGEFGNDMAKNCKTILEYAIFIVEHITNTNKEEIAQPEALLPNDLLQLLARDVILDEKIKVSTQKTPLVPMSSEIKCVLVTGATGQLAPYLIARIITSYKNIEKIYCLIHAASEEDATTNFMSAIRFKGLHNIVDLDKVECVPGDVILENLGVEGDTYNLLCDTVDAVFHCAANTNIFDHYGEWRGKSFNDIRSVNVGGTINVLRFASTSKTKQVYYPSFVLCSLYGEGVVDRLQSNWPDASIVKLIVDAGLFGLHISKFVCEILLKQANDRGIPCKSFRFPFIIGDSRTGRLDHQKNAYILRFLTYLKVKAMPAGKIPAIVLPVNTCADLSLQLFFDNETPFEVFNVVHSHPQFEQLFVDIAKNTFAKELKLLEFQEFSALVDNSCGDIKTENLRDLYANQRQLNLYISTSIKLVEGYFDSPESFFKCHKTLKYIPNYEEAMKPTMDIIQKNLLYLQSIKIFEEMGI